MMRSAIEDLEKMIKAAVTVLKGKGRIILWLIYIFLTHIPFSYLAYADDWGMIQGGLKTRIVPLQSKYVIGQPMRFRLEMTNVSDSELSYEYTIQALIKEYFYGSITTLDNLPPAAVVGWYNLITIKSDDGKEAPFVNHKGSQTISEDAIIKPGEVVILHPDFDISELYYLYKPGSYTIQFKGSGWNNLPPSNVLEVYIEAGNLSDLDTLTGCLLQILPETWHIGSRRSSSLCLQKIGGKKDEELVIKILQSKGFSPVSQEYQYLGVTPWRTFVYIALPDDINTVWPNAREKILKALKIF